MRRAVLVVALGLVAGCGSTPHPKPTKTTDDRSPVRTATPAPTPNYADAVKAALSARAGALGAGDAEALARSTLPAQLRRDADALAAIRKLDLRAVGYDPADLRITGPTARVIADLKYRVPGVAGRFAHRRRLIVRAQDDGSWRIASERPVGRERAPWEVAPLAVEREQHFRILHPQGLAVGALPAQLEQGYATMRALLPVPLAGRYLVVVGADHGQAAQLTSQIAGLETLAAVADTDVRESGPARTVSALVSQRLVIVWTNFAALDGGAQERLVTHELTHLALAERTSGRTPSWLVEGAALLVSGDRRVFEPGAPALAELSGPRAIARLSGAQQADAYARASGTAFYIADHYGRDAFFDLYEAFADPALRASSAAQLADAAVRRVLHTSLASLEKAAAQALATP